MAAYAALVSLTNVIHDIQHHHSPPISIDEKLLQSLTQSLTSLLEFLENSESPVADDDDEADPFEMRIADAAYAAADVIESHIVDVINHTPQDTRTHPRRNTSVAAKRTRFSNCSRASKKPKTAYDEQDSKFHQDLQRVIEEMDLIKQMAVKMNAEKAVAVHTHVASVSAVPLRPASSSTAMVCSDAVLNGLMDMLVEGPLDRHVIPIVGMGGIGKTTLALNIYERRNIKDRFDRRAWVTISQKYNTRDLLCEVLAHFTGQNKEQLGEKSEGDLGVELHQQLSYRRYILVMDDMWSIDAWEQIQQFLPDNMNGSRILVTTRLSQLSSQLNREYSLKMEFLDEDSSWDLFSKTVFGERRCPPDLMDIGEKIVENCRGLPLSIVVVGGLLKRMAHTQGSWESIEDNLTSIVNLENDKLCLKLLKLSYNHLPVYLKPCFLYMGMFEEDDKIKVSTIIKLWVSEGFLKPKNDRSLEAIAMEFLKDLVDRNLILIDRMGSTGNINSLKIHDLLRDLCLKEGEKEGFYHVVGRSQVSTRQCRRLLIPRNTSKKRVINDLRLPYARSVIFENGIVGCQNFRLLRTLHAYKFRTASYMNSSASRYVNLRHLAVEVHKKSLIFSSLNLFWNLRTLIISCSDYEESIMPAEIWKMPQLRHIEFRQSQVCLPDPPRSEKDEDVVMMENLEVIKGVENFKCSVEVVKRIPNLKKLKTYYRRAIAEAYSVSNIQFLSKLEHIHISSDFTCREALYLLNITFPQSLKKLSLWMNIEFVWEDILERISSLPRLEKLVLWYGCFKSGKWEMIRGQFPELKHMELVQVTGWKQWRVEDSSVMPRLEKLDLYGVTELEEIPIEIGYIETLQKVELTPCCESMVRSARAMVDEQVYEQGTDELPFHVQVLIRGKNEQLLGLSTPNFTIVCANVSTPCFTVLDRPFIF